MRVGVERYADGGVTRPLADDLHVDAECQTAWVTTALAAY
jgi:hypothetical protein